MFSSDHGPAPYAGNILKATPAQIHLLEATGHHPNGPHRGYKFSIYEGGLRVPLIARWPGVINKGQTCDSMVGLNDFMATFAELSASKLSDNEGPDSISFANLLRTPDAVGGRQSLVMQSVGAFAVRDKNWKLCLCPGSGTPGSGGNATGNDPAPDVAWREALEKFKGKPTDSDLLRPPFVQLFDLAEDPHEDRNLAVEHPARVKKMVALLQQQVKNGRSTPGPKLKNDKHVKIVNISDRRLPVVLRERLAQ
jgi:arylsulfatase A-like enzyme